MKKNLNEISIGYDAKRAFFNHSGLGNYSRDIIRIMGEAYPQTSFLLFKPKDKAGIVFDSNKNTSTILPQTWLYKLIPSLWRYMGISRDLKKNHVDLYHGLSHDLPLRIKKSKAKSVITIHDCIYLRYPELYDTISRWGYILKQKYSCKVADRIIAISEQTKDDIIKYYNVDESKIDVVYQGCNPIFYKKADEAKKKSVLEKHNLPANYILFVGNIEERKNLLAILEAQVEGGIDYPVVAVGRHTNYAQKAKQYAIDHGLNLQFIHGVDFDDLPAIYQMAHIFIYPSKFEGFGRPILEALESRVPVITTEGGVFSEVGGDAVSYVPFGNVKKMSSAIKELLSDDTLRQKMIDKGLTQAAKFKEGLMASNIQDVYLKTLNDND